MQEKRLLVLGNSFYDLSMRLRTMPEANSCALSDYSYSFTPGGSGLISAVLTSKMGVDTIFCSKVGEDEFGEKIKKTILDNNIDARFLYFTKKKQTGFETYLTESGNIKRKIVFNGANLSITDEELEDAFITYPDAFLVDTKIPDDTLFSSVDMANSLGVPVILNLSKPKVNFDIERLNKIDVLCINVDDMQALTGIRPGDTESSLHSCIKIINQIKCNYVVIRMAERGSFVFDGVYSQFIPAYAAEIADKTDVGTVFTAAFAANYIQTANAVKGAEFANAVCSLYISKEGTFSALPDSDDVLAFINKSGETE